MKRLLLVLTVLLVCHPEAESATTVPDGKAIFERNCSVCHSINPPSKSAPPIIPIASVYHRQFPSKAAGVSHMAAFMKAPSKASSKVDPEAITRFGLMPPMVLSDAELKAVAAWVWDMYNPNAGAGRGRGKGTGQGGGNCQ
ncbi:MAG: cytochrome c [Chlorobi bacterium]|nr:cytochrome c [Chlorobiota bacterium]